jgi:biotin/methionine sulfoxide reductase
MAHCRNIVTVSWSLQRTRHGEQAPWMGLTLAAMLGEIGLPGGGFGHGCNLHPRRRDQRHAG